jgi:hypothetical protein
VGDQPGRLVHGPSGTQWFHSPAGENSSRFVVATAALVVGLESQVPSIHRKQ